jgi:hypothetical protein
MPTYGYFAMDDVEPGRTWTADYIVSKGGQIQFWNRCSAGEKSDTLVGCVRLEEGSISDVALTSGNEAKTAGLAERLRKARERVAAGS